MTYESVIANFFEEASKNIGGFIKCYVSNPINLYNLEDAIENHIKSESLNISLVTSTLRLINSLITPSNRMIDLITLLLQCHLESLESLDKRADIPQNDDTLLILSTALEFNSRVHSFPADFIVALTECSFLPASLYILSKIISKIENLSKLSENNIYIMLHHLESSRLDHPDSTDNIIIIFSLLVKRLLQLTKSPSFQYVNSPELTTSTSMGVSKSSELFLDKTYREVQDISFPHPPFAPMITPLLHSALSYHDNLPSLMLSLSSLLLVSPSHVSYLTTSPMMPSSHSLAISTRTSIKSTSTVPSTRHPQAMESAMMLSREEAVDNEKDKPH
ncbi:hypothetical protein ADUPG1_014212 [Aduncisulcus paluster]|uniref:Uncharacterized protein n=1 Tax=Aduncisulcus paluster TaxID=2918883 RepID=A0ABQ5KB71_9EUKA|nr:hypothetical protein ADUPG1_014212 [Aduncisulcus paluster]